MSGERLPFIPRFLQTPSHELDELQETLLIQFRRLQPEPTDHHPPLLLVPARDDGSELHGDKLAGSFALRHGPAQECGRRKVCEREKRVVLVFFSFRCFVGDDTVRGVEGNVELSFPVSRVR